MIGDHGARRVAELTRQIEESDLHRDDLARERSEHVQVLRADGWSLGMIAVATGLSRSRVQQIASVGARAKL